MATTPLRQSAEEGRGAQSVELGKCVIKLWIIITHPPTAPPARAADPIPACSRPPPAPSDHVTFPCPHSQLPPPLISSPAARERRPTAPHYWPDCATEAREAHGKLRGTLEIQGVSVRMRSDRRWGAATLDAPARGGGWATRVGVTERGISFLSTVVVFRDEGWNNMTIRKKERLMSRRKVWNNRMQSNWDLFLFFCY